MNHRLFTLLLISVLTVLASGGTAHAQATTAWAACFATDTMQCSVAGRYYMDGSGGAARTPAWAKMAWERGCQNGDGASCRELGALSEAGFEAAAPDPARAFALYRQGCQAGSMSACHALARCHRAGVGVGVNVAEANRLDTWACEHGNGDACVRMAAAYANGEGVTADPNESRRLLARACEQGHGGACLGSGANVHGVQPVPPPPPGSTAPRAAPPAGAPSAVPPPPPPGASVQLQGPRPGHAAPAGGAPGAQPGWAPQVPGINPQVLEAGIQAGLPRLQRCHARRSRRTAIRGTVVVSWFIDARGRVQSPVVQPTSTIADRWMQRCVRGAVADFRFTPPGVNTAPVARTFGF